MKTPWLTHSLLTILTVCYFALIFRVPFWLAFVPAVFVVHRIGVLLHEYFHGIPFRKYRHNLAVVTLFDGLLMMFGMLELFRGTHLAHHRWLNTEQDSANETARRVRGKSLFDLFAATEVVQHFVYLADAIRGKKPYIRGFQMAFGFLCSVLMILLLSVTGYSDVIWKHLAIVLFTTLVPVSLRGAIEHHSYQGDSRFANEYHVWIPLFNLNRHIHHHEDPTLPWYSLEFRTERPLPHWNYFTYWYRVYIKRDFVMMKPIRQRGLKSAIANAV